MSRILLCGVLLCACVQAGSIDTIPLPHHFMWYTDRVVYLRIDTTVQTAPGKFQHTGEIRHLTFGEALRLMAEHWCSTEGLSFNLHDFNILSRYWPGHTLPDKPDPVEPTDNAFGAICYTVGGKHHLYADCRYLTGRDWTPCACNPDTICLTCAARRLSETDTAEETP